MHRVPADGARRFLLADGIFWSPDSRHLGFIAGNKLVRIDPATGAVKEI